VAAAVNLPKAFRSLFQLQSGCNLAAFLKDLDAPVLLSARSMLNSASMQNHPSSRCPIGLGSMHIIHFSAVDSLRRQNIGPATSWHIHISTSPGRGVNLISVIKWRDPELKKCRVQSTSYAHLTPRQDQSAVWRSRHDFARLWVLWIHSDKLNLSPVQHPDK
jgi:hypothetical protein